MKEFKVGDVCFHENRKQLVRIEEVKPHLKVVTISVSAYKDSEIKGKNPGFRFDTSGQFLRKLTKLERALL